MPNSIAFFPWVVADQPLSVGPLRLLPYKRKCAPGDLPYATQSDMDAVLAAYANHGGRRLDAATLFELGEWQTGADASELITDFFRARELIAFSALAERRFFSHFQYCNHDTYALIIQRYEAGAVRGFAFTTRRRDGGTTQFWSNDSFAFQRPLHIAHAHRLCIDTRLLLALLSLPNEHANIVEAIVEFNGANTDSGTIPEHVELVMIKSAFEWLLRVHSEASSLVRGLIAELPNASESIEAGPMQAKWDSRWPNASRPIEAWAREFCALRGASAHGNKRKAAATVWPARTHLLFAALLFPLLLKQILSRMADYKLDDFDLARLELIDGYLMDDPFDFDWDERDASEHPWSKLDFAAFADARAHLFYPTMHESGK